MSRPVTSSVFNPSVWAKPVLISMVGQEEYDYMQSPQFKQLMANAQAQSPGKRVHDKRTKAYRYLKKHERAARKEYEKLKGGSDVR